MGLTPHTIQAKKWKTVFLQHLKQKGMDKFQLLFGAKMEALLPAIATKHQQSNALFHPKHGDMIPENLQPLKQVDIAENILCQKHCNGTSFDMKRNNVF